MTEKKEERQLFSKAEAVDRFGNLIRKGKTLHWGKIDNPVEVLDVLASHRGEDGEGKDGYVDIKLRLPFPFNPDAQYVAFRDFMTIETPQQGEDAESAVTKAVEHQKRQQEAAAGSGMASMRRPLVVPKSGG